MEQQDRDVYCFGPYTLDPSTRSLSRDEKPLVTPSRSFDLLRVLLQNAGKVVKKGYLLKTVWPDVKVIDNNVDRQVSNLRQILGKTAAGLDYIQNVHGEGYIIATEVSRKQKHPSSLPMGYGPLPIQTQPRLEGSFSAPTTPYSYLLIYSLLAVSAVFIGYLGVHFLRSPAPAKFPAGPEVLADTSKPYEAGIVMLHTGNVREAKKMLEEAVTAEPRRAVAHSALSADLGLLGYEVRSREEAKESWDLLPATKGEDTLVIKAQYYWTNLDWQAACRTYETLYSMFPGDVWYAKRYALALSQAGRISDAYDVVAKLKVKLSLDTRDPQIDLTEAAVAESGDDYDREYQAAVLAETRARTEHRSYVVARSLLQQGWALDNLSKLADAEAKDKSALALLADLNDIGGEAQAWKNLGDVYSDSDRLELARSAYRSAISNFQQIGWRSGEAVALNNLGYVLRDLGDLPAARELFEQSLAISRSIGDLRRQGMALNGVAIVLKRSGNLSGAAEAYMAALEINRRLSDDGKSATVLNNLAIVFQDQGNLDEARRKLDEAFNIFRRLGRQADVAMVLGNLGDLEIRRGDVSSAEQDYRAQVDIGRRIRQAKQIGYGLFGLGESCFLRNDKAHATEYLQRSLKERTLIQDAGLVAETQLALAEVNLEEKRFTEAEFQARAAATEFHKDRQGDQETVAWATLAEALIGGGKTSEAVSIFQSVQKLLNSSEDKDSQMAARLHLWKVIDAIGSSQSAIETLKSVQNDAEQCRYLPRLLEAEAALAQLKLKSGDRSAEHDLADIRSRASRIGLSLIVKRAAEPKLSIASARP